MTLDTFLHSTPLNGLLWIWSTNDVLIQGIQGPIGPTGLTGATGAQGTQGIQGIQGVTGPTGPQGPQGVTGPTGIQGRGLAILGSFDTFAQLTATITSPVLGDGYLIQGQLYVWQGSAWINAGFVQGPTGPTGLTGAQGPTGATGAASTVPGPTGATGPTPFTVIGTWQSGISYTPGQAVFYDTPTLKGTYLRRNNASTAGITPLDDPAGWQVIVAATIGPTGATGPQGLTGLQGPTGEQGPQGITGPTGSQGLLGPTGPTGTTLLNVDGGGPATNYGGVITINGGGVDGN